MPPEQDKRCECHRKCRGIDYCNCPCHGKGEKKQIEPCGCINFGGNGLIPKYCPKHLKENISPLPDKVEEWEKEFVKRFFVYNLNIKGNSHDDHVGAEKDALIFIRSLLKSEMPYAHGYADGLANGELLVASHLSTLKGKVEGIKRDTQEFTRDGGENSRPHEIQNVVWNAALDAVIHLIDTKG